MPQSAGNGKHSVGFISEARCLGFAHGEGVGVVIPCLQPGGSRSVLEEQSLPMISRSQRLPDATAAF